MFVIVVYVLLPVRILIDCVSVVVSCGGRSVLVCALVSLNSMFLCIRVMSPPPFPPARSCLSVV